MVSDLERGGGAEGGMKSLMKPRPSLDLSAMDQASPGYLHIINNFKLCHIELFQLYWWRGINRSNMLWVLQNAFGFYLTSISLDVKGNAVMQNSSSFVVPFSSVSSIPHCLVTETYTTFQKCDASLLQHLLFTCLLVSEFSHDDAVFSLHYLFILLYIYYTSFIFLLFSQSFVV